MPDERRHRGPHPRDAVLFSEAHLDVLRAATDDLSWMLTRGYAPASAAALVGNRYQLTEQQRMAVQRCSRGDHQRDGRRARSRHARGGKRRQRSPGRLRRLAQPGREVVSGEIPAAWVVRL